MRGMDTVLSPHSGAVAILGMDVNSCGDVHADFCNIEIANPPRV